MKGTAPTRRVLGLALLAVCGAPGATAAQQARGWVGSTAQVVGMRPVEVLAEPCPADGRCYDALDPELAAMASQDLFLTAWGFGLQGLSATVQLRTRQDLGGGFSWPRSDDRFDAMLAYATWVRDGLTARAGRQEVRSGLGFPSFDGALVRWGGATTRVEIYGGRSLARGLREPADEALRGLDDFVPDQSAILLGGSIRARVGGAAVTGRYQRELLSDRSGLASERASLDASAVRAWGALRGALDYDFGRGALGKGHLTFSRTAADARWVGELSLVRYMPYFSLSTIWGFFEPVAYHEGVVRVGWAPAEAWALRASAGIRRYGDAGATVVLRPLDRTGRRAGLEVRWRAAGPWTAGAGYDLEWGPGGFLSSVEGHVAWTPAAGTHLTVSARSFQQVEQYRLGDDRALGGALSGGVPVADRLTVSGGASVLRHGAPGGTEPGAWNQVRAWTSVRVALGSDPGSPGRGGGS